MVRDLPKHGTAQMLNDAKVKAAKPGDKPYKLTDAGQLYLLVATSGSKTWRMNYAYRASPAAPPQQKTLSLGRYPIVTLLKAREERDRAKALLRDGIDPSAQKKIDRMSTAEAQAATFEVVARQWLAKQRPRWAKVHADDVLTNLTRDVFPAIGALPIATIKAPKLLEVLTAVEARGAIETAHRIRSRISSVFVYAIGAGLAEADPAASLGKALTPKPRSKKQPAITELHAARQMLIDCDAERCRASTKLAMRFMALTAVRSNELRGARWAEFEHIAPSANGEPLWRIPAARMKGDDERKAEDEGDHLVPLAPQSVEILRVLHRLSGDLDLVFPSERHVHRSISENTLRELLIRAGYHGRHVAHGFRSTFSTIMNERAERAWRAAGHAGYSPDRAILDLMLAHVPKDKTEGAYNRAAYMPRRRELACEWADLLVADFWPPETWLGQPIRYMPGTARP